MLIHCILSWQSLFPHQPILGILSGHLAILPACSFICSGHQSCFSLAISPSHSSSSTISTACSFICSDHYSCSSLAILPSHSSSCSSSTISTACSFTCSGHQSCSSLATSL